MKILALDLGKSKSVAYRLDSETGEVGFKTVLTRPATLARLAARWRPDRVVFEIGPLAGWVHEVMTGCGVRQIQVANPWSRLDLESDSENGRPRMD